MQCGFALLESGTIRVKNTRNILLKNGAPAPPAPFGGLCRRRLRAAVHSLAAVAPVAPVAPSPPLP